MLKSISLAIVAFLALIANPHSDGGGGCGGAFGQAVPVLSHGGDGGGGCGGVFG